MLFSILKDSFILFLLVYALLSLAENFSRFLEQKLKPRIKPLPAYHIIDIRNILPDELEIPLKNALKTAETPLFLLADNLHPEAEKIVSAMQKQSENVQLIHSACLEKISGFPKETADIFIRDDGHSCHSNRSTSS